jgi:hypothetical protein
MNEMKRIEITLALLADWKNTDKVTGTCYNCGSSDGVLRRQDTAYCEEVKNWSILCAKCQEEADENWRLQWEEYYNG